MDLKDFHDSLLESYPERPHDRSDCPLCASENGMSSPVEGGDMSKTYTQEELDAAVTAALEPVQKSLEELKAGMEQSEVEARFSQEKAELEASIADLQAQLDSAVLKASEAEKRYDDLVAMLEEATAAAEAKAEAAARMEARLARVNEVASFPEEYVAANAERWASMSDEDFETLVADWAAIAKPKEEAAEEVVFPETTAMVASRSDAKPTSAVREIFDLTIGGIDPRTV